jgi:hypothetical protein
MDKAHVGGKCTPVSSDELASTARQSPLQGKFVIAFASDHARRPDRPV